VIGKGSYAEIAQRYNLNPLTVRDWQHRDSWLELRTKREMLEVNRLLASQQTIKDLPKYVPNVANEISILQAHILATDHLLQTCFDPKDVAQLTRARKELQEQLWIAERGVKPGTQKTRAQRATRQPEVNPLAMEGEPSPIAAVETTIETPSLEPQEYRKVEATPHPVVFEGLE